MKMLIGIWWISVILLNNFVNMLFDKWLCILNEYFVKFNFIGLFVIELVKKIEKRGGKCIIIREGRRIIVFVLGIINIPFLIFYSQIY